MNKIVINKPCLGKEELDAVRTVFESSWIGPGQYCEQFEKKVGELIGRPVVAVNSCTSALHMALIMLGVEPGDEVITTPLTFAATANVIEHCGAKTVFADVCLDTMNIDPKEIAKKITKRTKAIIVVHFAGLPCGMKRIMGFGIPVIEDCAHAIDATIEGKHCGTFGYAGCFSFYANKTITTIVGGALAIKDIKKAKRLSNQGLDIQTWDRIKKKSIVNDIVNVGYEYQMPDVNAAIGLEQLKKLKQFEHTRSQIWNYYHNVLSYHYRCQNSSIGRSHYLFPILAVDRGRVVKKFNESGVVFGIHFPPIHLFSYYRKKYGYKKGCFPVVEYIGENTISLPINPEMGINDAERVADIVRGMK